MARVSLAWRFLLGSLAILALGMTGVGLWVSRQIEDGVIHRTAATTALYVDSLIAAPLQDLAAGPTLSTATVSRLDWLMGETPLGQQVAVFRVWNSAGQIVYSTAAEPIGQKFPIEGELAAALGGAVTADIGDVEGDVQLAPGLHRHDLLEIYSPVRASSGDAVIGVAEFYYGTADLRGEIDRAQRRSWLVVLGAAAAIYLVLAVFVQRASDTIIRQQRTLADQVVRLTEIVQQNEVLHRRVRDAAARTTALNERVLRRLAAELHDGPAQEISLAVLQLDHLAARCTAVEWSGAEREEAARELDQVQQHLRHALHEVRATSAGLMLPHLGELSLPATIDHAVRAHRRRTRSDVETDLDGVAGDAPLATKIAIYRIVQEALTNAWRHAGGAGQRVHVAQSDGAIRVEIADAGSGFDAATMGGDERHLGLVGMRERVESLGGSFAIASAPGRGTRVIATLPAPPEGASDDENATDRDR